MKSVIRRLIYYYSLDVPRYTFLCGDKGPMHPDVKMRPNRSQPQRLRALLFFKFFNQAIKDAEHDLFSSYPGDRFFLSLYLSCKTRDFWLSCLPSEELGLQASPSYPVYAGVKQGFALTRQALQQSHISHPHWNHLKIVSFVLGRRVIG